MSIDISYFSYNPKRADKQWVVFWDIDLRDFTKKHEQNQKLESDAHRLEIEIIQKSSAREYFKKQGILNPTDLELSNAEESIERGEIKWQPAISKLEAQLSAMRLKLGTETSELGLSDQNLIYTLQEDEIDRKILELDILELDVKFGSIKASIHEGKFEQICLFTLFSIIVPEIDLGVKDAWDMITEKVSAEQIITLYENISLDKIYKAFDEEPDKIIRLMDLKNISTDELPDWEELLIEFAKQVQPIAKDLKENGGMFVTRCNGDFTDSPLLKKRQKEHLAKLLNNNPWVQEKID